MAEWIAVHALSARTSALAVAENCPTCSKLVEMDHTVSCRTYSENEERCLLNKEVAIDASVSGSGWVAQRAKRVESGMRQPASFAA